MYILAVSFLIFSLRLTEKIPTGSFQTKPYPKAELASSDQTDLAATFPSDKLNRNRLIRVSLRVCARIFSTSSECLTCAWSRQRRRDCRKLKRRRITIFLAEEWVYRQITSKDFYLKRRGPGKMRRKSKKGEKTEVRLSRPVPTTAGAAITWR